MIWTKQESICKSNLRCQLMGLTPSAATSLNILISKSKQYFLQTFKIQWGNYWKRLKYDSRTFSMRLFNSLDVSRHKCVQAGPRLLSFATIMIENIRKTYFSSIRPAKQRHKPKKKSINRRLFVGLFKYSMQMHFHMDSSLVTNTKWCIHLATLFNSQLWQF